MKVETLKYRADKALDPQKKYFKKYLEKNNFKKF